MPSHWLAGVEGATLDSMRGDWGRVSTQPRTGEGSWDRNWSRYRNRDRGACHSFRFRYRYRRRRLVGL